MQDDVMLAFLMNGEKLPKEHGFPIRLIVPGLYGIKNVKWIVEIEVYPGDYQGYWQRKGWTDDGTIKIFSRIDSPGHYQTLRGHEQVFRGIAFGGPNSISKVELSFDAGRTWNECQIEPPMSPYSWVIWNYTWKPPKREVPNRCPGDGHEGTTPDRGNVRPQPAGASGLHTIIADVRRSDPASLTALFQPKLPSLDVHTYSVCTLLPVRFELDEAKRKANIAQHGIHFQVSLRCLRNLYSHYLCTERQAHVKKHTTKKRSRMSGQKLMRSRTGGLTPLISQDKGKHSFCVLFFFRAEGRCDHSIGPSGLEHSPERNKLRRRADGRHSPHDS